MQWSNSPIGKQQLHQSQTHYNTMNTHCPHHTVLAKWSSNQCPWRSHLPPLPIHKEITPQKQISISQNQICLRRDKWKSNDEIDHKHSNHFWATPDISDVQITQTLKLQYAQYMGNHHKDLIWPITHSTPNCILCLNNIMDTWPYCPHAQIDI